jgi:hypothetical protein
MLKICDSKGNCYTEDDIRAIFDEVKQRAHHQLELYNPMLNRNRMILAVGDWSNDGHGQCKEFTVEYTGTIERAREAHFNAKNVTGFDLQDFNRQYEDYKMSDDLREICVTHGWTFAENFDMDDLITGKTICLSANAVAQLWVNILNLTDPSLDIKMVAVANLPTLHFYGFDEKRRHLNTPGYGVFE